MDMYQALKGAGMEPLPRRRRRLGTLRHGQLLGRPLVRQVDDETVSVGFKAARPQVYWLCWRRTSNSPRLK